MKKALAPPPANLNPPLSPSLAGRAAPAGPAFSARLLAEPVLAEPVSTGSVSQDGREQARAYAWRALARMAELMEDPDPKIAFPACREILDRAWGKAEAASKAEGESGRLTVVIRALENV